MKKVKLGQNVHGEKCGRGEPLERSMNVKIGARSSDIKSTQQQLDRAPLGASLMSIAVIAFVLKASFDLLQPLSHGHDEHFHLERSGSGRTQEGRVGMGRATEQEMIMQRG